MVLLVFMRRAHPLMLALPLVFTAACAEPPHKEMNQAQGAIDAARAAGAERYAPRELAAAVDALARADQAVTQRDYRLALAQSIDGREQAQRAARAAVDNRAEARGDVERIVTASEVLLTQAQRRFETFPAVRGARKSLESAQQTLATAQKAMQEARAALQGEDYDRAGQLARDVSAAVQRAQEVLDALEAPPPNRRRR